MEDLEDPRQRHETMMANLWRVAIYFGAIVGLATALSTGDWRPLLLCVPLIIVWKNLS